MARPTRYCRKCGEYVTEMFVTIDTHPRPTTVERLVHIDGAGTQIHRAHAAIEA